MTQAPNHDPNARGTSGEQVGASPRQAQGVTPSVCPQFSETALRRQLSIDTAIRWAVVGAVIFVILTGRHWSDQSPLLWTAVVVGVGAVWILTSMVSSRVFRMLPRITALVEDDPPAAEAFLAGAIKRWPLHRSLRLLLYHRLAALRYRQERFGEAADICQAILAQKPTPPPPARARLLVMLVESCLERADLAGAYAALMELCRMRLSMIDALQRVWLQTRYEVAAGYDAQAVANLEKRVELAELMPPPQCAAMHALLAIAAERAEQPERAAWLHARARLLCTDDQLAQVERLAQRAV